jgi:pyocin large subunit-like protein
MKPRPSWYSDADARSHFAKHGHKFPYSTVQDYGASSIATVQVGVRFTYKTEGVARVGYYHRGVNHFTGVTEDDFFIVTHFPPDDGEQYCRQLDESTYR